MDNINKMKRVIQLAREALSKGEIPIAAVIYNGDEVISESYTSENLDRRFLVHAEFKALLKADKLKPSIKERKKMQLFTNLEPCMMCLGTAMSFFIGEIYYSLEAPMDGAVDFALEKFNKECLEIPSYNLPKINKGILRNESIELFKIYADNNKKSPTYQFAKSLSGL